MGGYKSPNHGMEQRALVGAGTKLRHPTVQGKGSLGKQVTN